MDYLLCSACFVNEGLRLCAAGLGEQNTSQCVNCGKRSGSKLKEAGIEKLAYLFFVWGTLSRGHYGAAPVIQFNDVRETGIEEEGCPPELVSDMTLIEETIGIRFFHYGPRMWMIGEGIEPLDALMDEASREAAIDALMARYPKRVLTPECALYRIRCKLEDPTEEDHYDSPPSDRPEHGRLDSGRLPVLYASQSIPICLHECRVSAEDEIYMATLTPTRDLELLDLTGILDEQVSDFKSLDTALNMLFLAGEHSYPICRDIAFHASKRGYSGVLYPSYYSLLETGHIPFETVLGISNRRVPQLRDYERSKVVPNVGIFGRPIADGLLRIRCINRAILGRVQYHYHFGPVGF